MGPDVVELAVRRGAEVDRGRAAAGRGRPGGSQELLAGGDQVVGAAADPLRLHHHHLRVVRHRVDEELQLVHEHRRERLHALDRDPGGDLRGHLGQLRVSLAQRGGAAADVLGQQQLAARRCPQPWQRLDRALVGDREGPHLLHVVAPELHPHRVLLGRREDVDQTPADRELAALLDQVHAGVRRVREAAYDVVELGGVAGPQLHGREVPQPRDLRLEDRPDRCDHHPQPAGAGTRVGVAQPAQDGQPTAHRVAAGAEPLVRQRLPARVVGDRGRVDERPELLGQLLGLASGGGHQQDGALGADQARDQERPDAGGRRQVEAAHARRVDQGLGERTVAEHDLGQGGQDHEHLEEVGRTAREPPTGDGRGCGPHDSPARASGAAGRMSSQIPLN